MPHFSDFLPLVLAIVLWCLLHSMLASRRAKELVRRLFGAAGDRWYRLAYNLFACISLLPVLVVILLAPDQGLYVIPFPWNLLLFTGQGFALMAVLAGIYQTGAISFLGLDALRVERGMEKKGHLVTTGLYRYVRHPLYTAGIVFIWLMPLMTVRVLLINALLTVYMTLGALHEDSRLLLEYGETYRDYAAFTPMLIPFLGTKRGQKRLGRKTTPRL